MPPVTTKAAILQALTLGPAHGLAIIDIVAERTGGAVTLAQGSVYPALAALEGEGLLEVSEEVSTGRGGRPRRYYRLTARGVEAAKAGRAAVAGLYGFWV